MPYETFISISLTAVTVVLAALALLIGVLALWGYSAIKNEARGIAEKAAKSEVAKFLDSEQIQDKLREEIRRKVREEADAMYADIAMPYAFPVSATEGSPIASEYPEEDNARPGSNSNS